MLPVTIGVYGKKLKMTRCVTSAESAANTSNSLGTFTPVTIVELGPNLVTQVKSRPADRHHSIQLAYDEVKAKSVLRSSFGKTRKSGSTRLFRSFGEFRIQPSHIQNFTVGRTLDVSLLKVGQRVTVTGRPLGTGFMGTIKRHNFSRGPMTHGSKNHRLPGSIGSGTTPGRVYPGKKMAGRRSVTSRVNSKILAIHNETNLLVLKGSLPGSTGNFLKISLY
uniref:Large ribosomal subunit protein uL3c n=2 Tax=Karenia mikimotoi TaxID=225107 RepID=A0A0U1V1T4_KARMI|nr:ribosomal protein L3 [Karenia mikimotoi]